MPFGEAIPVNRVAQSGTSFGMGMRQERPMSGWSRMPKQRVNISEETMMKAARAKLGKAVSRKIEYNRQGEFRDQALPGRFLSVKV